MSTLTQPIKRHGGKGAFKGALARWIIGLFPPRCKTPNAPKPGDVGWLHYVEPYFGGGSVLLANDPTGISEVVNDKDQDLTNFWRVMRCPTEFQQFQRFCQATEFNQSLWDGIGPEVKAPSPVDWAWRFFVRSRQSLSGRLDGFASITRNRVRGGMNEQASAWLGAVDGLAAVHERLRRVLVLGPMDATEVIRREDGPRTLFYLDPPYLHETRATTGEYGEHEMSVEDHRRLLETLCGIEGRFVLSGYASELYAQYAGLSGWNVHEFEIANCASGGSEKRRMTECCWTNY